MKKIEPTITLSVETLIDECSLGNLPKEDHYSNFSLTNRENVSDVFRYKKFKNDFATTLTCSYDAKSYIGRIKNSYDEFLKCIIKQLNLDVPENFADDDNLTIALNKKIEELSQIKNERELRAKFPWIWGDLVEGRKYMRVTRDLLKLEPQNADDCGKRRHYFYACAMREKIKGFIEYQTKAYQRFVNRRHDFKEKLASRDFNSYIELFFDLNRVALYMAHEYLKKCETTDDIEMINTYLAQVSKYFQTKYSDTHVSIKVDKAIIDINNIKARYEKQKKRLLPKINKVEWIIIPNDQKIKKVKKGKNPRSLEVDLEKLTRLKEHGKRKEDFYGQTDYVAIIVGVLSNKGYVGYLYENGEIVFDREYISYHPSTATGNAIYNLKIYDFETLSKLTKSKLKNHPKARKIVHSKKWEERVAEIIEREATEQEKENVKKFIKKYQK